MLRQPTNYGDDDVEMQHIFSDGIFVYDVPTLWKLAAMLPHFELSSSHFLRFLNRKVWSDSSPMRNGGDGEHWERVLEADLKFPILVKTSFDVLSIVDGCHRVTKAFLEDLPFILAIDVTDVLLRARIAEECYGDPRPLEWSSVREVPA